jgi:hypothetical protein
MPARVGAIEEHDRDQERNSEKQDRGDDGDHNSKGSLGIVGNVRFAHVDAMFSALKS